MTPKEIAYQAIAALVEKFGSQPENYKVSTYNETLTRRDFIDPFFEALGWDINNKAGAWEAYREVIHEDRLKIDGVSKAPDYSFRLLGGHRLFFVEAKKPSVHIKDDTAPAYQVRLYGWNAKLAISVVTDFEEFAIYDCSKKPNKTDKTATARLNYFTYKDYLTQFDFLWETFSREQVIKGGLIKFQRAEKKGTATVDREFLNSLDQWRVLLAANISKNNPEVSEDDLNYAVQQTIDRIIFLRIAEDRGLEPYGQLKSATKHDNFYKDLFLQFNQADAKYNSGLFHFRKEKDNPNPEDKITGSLVIDNKTIKTIINSLYPPESDFLFDVLPVEILGSAYEQFLGKQIVVGKTGKATIEEKPEVRKAGGVYYTPQYIVEYIVQHTVGKLTEGKTPVQVSKLKIVDPACGSGSFLLGAYQYLLNWHMQYYKANGADPKKKNAPINADGSLTTAEKKRILVNNLYGVDLDKNAVEVTKLSLLLKCMEGETMQTVNDQMKLLHERVLPSLENNIKCGNSLIDLDYYEGSLDFGEEKKIKPFSWEQNFPVVFKQGGFDVVVGNPPYIQSREGQLGESQKHYYYEKYTTTEYQINTFGLFIEKGMKLLKAKGILGYIIPNYWLSTKYDQKLRKFLFQQNSVSEIVNVFKIFEAAVVDTLLLIVQNDNKKTKLTEIKAISKQAKTIPERLELIKSETWSFKRSFITTDTDSDINISFQDTFELKGRTTIKDHFILKFGAKLYEVGKGTPPQKKNDSKDAIYEASEKLDKFYKKLVKARHVKHYYLGWKDNWVKYGSNLAAPRSINIFQGHRILLQRIVSKSVIDAVVTDEELICNTDVITLLPIRSNVDCYYFLGVLNSKVCGKYIKSQNVNLDRDAFPKINTNTLESFPVPNTNLPLQELISQNVKIILELNTQLQETTTTTHKDQLVSRIIYTEDKINMLVYEIYGLTQDEIKIVEGENHE